MGWDAQDSFVEKYTKTCLARGAYDVDSVFWYYYRPERDGCTLDAADVVEIPATLSPNAQETEGMYPEYDKVWEDDTLNVVIFGKAVEDSEGYDGGIQLWNFTSLVEEELGESLISTEAFGEGECVERREGRAARR